MTKLPVISGLDAIKAFRRAGFIVVRQRGSHVRMKKVTGEKVINITVPMHDILKKGTLHHLVNDSGLTLDEFLEFL
jgi:predicted RNA binding protein YcfA (HicA-like mRNA interferase family)